MYQMEITEINIKPAEDQSGPLQATVRVVFNGCLAVGGIRIVRGKFGLFISWPGDHGKTAAKMVYPITKDLQAYASERILREHRMAVRA